MDLQGPWHKMSLTFFHGPQKVKIYLFSVQATSHSVTKRLVSFLFHGQENLFNLLHSTLFSPVCMCMYCEYSLIPVRGWDRPDFFMTGTKGDDQGDIERSITSSCNQSASCNFKFFRRRVNWVHNIVLESRLQWSSFRRLFRTSESDTELTEGYIIINSPLIGTKMK